MYFFKRNMTSLCRQHGFGAGGEGALGELPLCEIVSIRITHIPFLPVQPRRAGEAFISQRTACPCSYSWASCQGKSYLEDFIIILSSFSKIAAGDLFLYVCCKGASGSPHRHKSSCQQWWFPLLICKEKCKRLGLAKGRANREAVINIVIRAETSS